MHVALTTVQPHVESSLPLPVLQGVCRMVPAADAPQPAAAAAAEQLGSSQAGSTAKGTGAAAVRQRQSGSVQGMKAVDL